MSSRSEKRKNIRLMLMLGFSSSAMAVVMAFLVWAWSPLSANWTLPAQEIANVAEPTEEVDRRWVPMRFPTRTHATALPSDVGSEPEATPSEIASVETALETSIESDDSTAAPIDFTPQGNADAPFGPSFSVAGLGGPAMGGPGTSWNGTFNPNPSRGSPRSFGAPPYSGPGGGGPGTDPCDVEPAKSQDPSCKTTSGDEGQEEEQENVAESGEEDGTDGDNGNGNGTGGGSICTTTTINGVVQYHDCTDDETETGSGGPSGSYCVTSTVNGVTTYEGDCPTNQVMADALMINANAITDPSTLQVPEPSSLALFLVAFAGLALLIRRRRA